MCQGVSGCVGCVTRFCLWYGTNPAGGVVTHRHGTPMISMSSFNHSSSMLSYSSRTFIYFTVNIIIILQCIYILCQHIKMAEKKDGRVRADNGLVVGEERAAMHPCIWNMYLIMC